MILYLKEKHKISTLECNTTTNNNSAIDQCPRIKGSIYGYIVAHNFKKTLGY
jgi:hypothetical protein